MTAAVVVLGGFGRGDAGAEARLDAVLESLPMVEVVAVSDSPPATEARHGCAAVAASARAVAGAVRRADGVLVAGGDLFGAGEGCTRDRRLAWAAAVAAKGRGLPVALLGVGSRGTVQRRGAGALLRAADLAVIRDPETATLLAAAGLPTPVRVGADPAWATVTPVPAAGPGDAVTVFVDGALGPEHTAALGRSVAALEAPAHVVPWRDVAEDHRCADAVRSTCGRHADVVDPSDDLRTVAATVAGARLVVAHQAHASLAAAACQRRFLAIGATPEAAGIARRLGQQHVPAHAPAAVLNRAVTTSVDMAPPAPERVAELAARARDGFALTRVVLGLSEPEQGLGAHLHLDGGPLAW